MKKITTSQKFWIFIYGAAIILFCHHFIIRPVILDWGSTREIRSMKLQGDSLTRGVYHTRAILINAKPDEIWPWLVQLGQDRGGFYSYQWLENIFRAEMRNAYDIKPEFQQPRLIGDTIWLANKSHYNGEGYQIVAEIIPQRSLVMVGATDFARINLGEEASGSWAFYLYPANADQTWLVVRSSDSNMTFGNKVLRYFYFEVPHFIMERKMLKTMKKLAEEKKNDLNIVKNENDY